jgi:uroporphyrinogen III methyltransferase/synthase
LKIGKVYLVGSGPGDPELITLKALKLLRKADVIVYDRLIPKSILKLIPSKSKKIYVGKFPGKHKIPQEKINEILINEALKGKKVVRLKNGDPFLFSRGGEEAQELRKAGIPFEIVPGVPSAIAVPAYAGIPITHRDYSSSIAIVTGHESQAKPNSRVKWDKLVNSVDTLIVLMGVKKLKNILKCLIEGGLSYKTKIAIIENGTTKNQKTIIGTAKDILKKAKKHEVKPPAVIVIGNVVELQKTLAWFKDEKIFA